MDIKLNRAEFDTACTTIQGLQSRSWENNASYQTDILSATDAASVLNYQDAIESIKDSLQRYNQQLQEDLTNLKLIADTIETAG